MQRNCHEFIAYENLVGAAAAPASSSGGRRPQERGGVRVERVPIDQAVPLVVRALQVLSEREVSPQMGLLKSTLLQLDSTFSERSYGAGSFRDFVEKLEKIGPDEYKAVMKVGVGPVKGTFEGKVRLLDQEPPHRYRMAVEGSGGPGFVRGEAVIELAEAEGGTRVSYNADVQVGGLIASVGQRMLGGVSRMMLDQFFGKMTEILTAPK